MTEKNYGELRLDNNDASPPIGAALVVKVLKYPHPALTRKAKPLVRVDAELKKTIREMFDLMHQEKGIGLAATQVGLPYRFFIMNLAASIEGMNEEYVFINPAIKKRSGMATLEEGCLSLPDIYAEVRRPDKIVISAFDINGEEFTYELSGLLARAAQHEYDHIDGIVFTDRLDWAGKRAVKGALAELEEEFETDRRLGRIPDDKTIKKELEELESLRT